MWHFSIVISNYFILLDNDKTFFYISILGQKEMNKINKTLNKLKAKLTKQVRIMLRAKHYNIQTEE
jgi:hypothetical protein